MLTALTPFIFGSDEYHAVNGVARLKRLHNFSFELFVGNHLRLRLMRAGMPAFRRNSSSSRQKDITTKNTKFTKQENKHEPLTINNEQLTNQIFKDLL